MKLQRRLRQLLLAARRQPLIVRIRRALLQALESDADEDQQETTWAESAEADRAALQSYLQVFCRERYAMADQVPDGSSVLDCLVHGFELLALRMEQNPRLELDAEQQKALSSLEARLRQIAFASKHWIAVEEWDGVRDAAWWVIEAFGFEDAEDGEQGPGEGDSGRSGSGEGQ